MNAENLPTTRGVFRWRRIQMRTVLKLTVALVAAMAAVVTVQAADRPNILVIWGDDIGWSNLGAYNHGSYNFV